MLQFMGHKELDNNNIILFVSYLCQEILKFQLLYLPLTSGPGWLVGWFSHYVMSDFCDPMDFSLPGSFAHGILQARILEWLPFPSPGDLPDPGIKPGSPALQADSLPTEL